MKRDVVDDSPKCVGAVDFSITICGLEQIEKHGVGRPIGTRESTYLFIYS
jgi:hypothetical protein